MPRSRKRIATPSLLASLLLGAAGCATPTSVSTPAALGPAPASTARFSTPAVAATPDESSVAPLASKESIPLEDPAADGVARHGLPGYGRPRPTHEPPALEPSPAPITLASHQVEANPLVAPRVPAEFESIPPREAETIRTAEGGAEAIAAPPAASLPGPGASDESVLPPAAWTFNLGNVLYLANAQNPNVNAARERIREAYARVNRVEAAWLPSLRTGVNYNHHEGRIQDVAGNVFETSRSAAYGGLGAGAVGAASPAVPGIVAQFHVSDAIFQPRIAEHQAVSRQFAAAAARNDVLRDAAVAYLELLRAEHALAVAQAALANTERLAGLTRQYAETGQGLESDFQRVEADLALRTNDVFVQVEAVQVASARLAQLLHADPAQLIATGEPAVAPIELVPAECTPADLVATGLSRRPELFERRRLTAEAVERLRREKFAPLVPSVLLGVSYGGFGGGLGGDITDSGDRLDADAMAYWELRNLGLGEHAARNEASSVVRQTQWRETAQLDQVAREVVEAHARVTQRKRRVELARRGMDAAQRSYFLNQQRIENAQGLPIEALQSVQALAAAQRAYLDAVVDHNIAQFELCRAIGWFANA